MYGSSSQLSAHQQSVLTIIERVSSCFSVTASAFVIATFLGSTEFRKPINRLIFFASWGNIMSNVATLVAETGVRNGPGSSLCQFQAFMIQWFMPADSLWALAMACNVYLASFKHYDTRRLRMLEWKYLLFCYGLPFIPAFVFLFVKSKTRGRVYGHSVIWCWISLSWDFLQIATLYGPVWFIILLIFSIYIRVGLSVYRQRREIRKFLTPPFDHDTHTTLSDLELGGCSHPVERPSSLLSPSSDIPSESWMATTVAHDTDSDSYHSSISNAYFKYAVLFFAALFVTWVPSSANRVYGLAKSNRYVFGLSCASSFALPLQGFWNSIIYVTVSWQAVRKLLRDIRGAVVRAVMANSSRLKSCFRRWRHT